MEPAIHPFQVAVVLHNNSMFHHTVFAVNEYEVVNVLQKFYSFSSHTVIMGVIFYSTEE